MLETVDEQEAHLVNLNTDFNAQLWAGNMQVFSIRRGTVQRSMNRYLQFSGKWRATKGHQVNDLVRKASKVEENRIFRPISTQDWWP